MYLCLLLLCAGGDDADETEQWHEEERRDFQTSQAQGGSCHAGGKGTSVLIGSMH